MAVLVAGIMSELTDDDVARRATRVGEVKGCKVLGRVEDPYARKLFAASAKAKKFAAKVAMDMMEADQGELQELQERGAEFLYLSNVLHDLAWLEARAELGCFVAPNIQLGPDWTVYAMDDNGPLSGLLDILGRGQE